MKRTTAMVAALGLALALAPSRAHSDDSSIGRRLWNGLQAAAMNTVPVVSALAAPRCLPGYIACKVSFAAMGLVASGTQVIVGGDVDGAGRTLQRAFGGDWVVTPRHVATGAKPDPYPEVTGDDASGDLPPI